MVVSVFQGFKSRFQKNLNNYKRKLEIGDRVQCILHMNWYSLLLCFGTMNYERGKKEGRERKKENIVSVICQKVTGCKNKFRIGDNEDLGLVMNEPW